MTSTSTASPLRALLTAGLPVAMPITFRVAMVSALARVSLLIPTLIVCDGGVETNCAYPNHSRICGPRRLIRATVGKTCGETGQASARSAAPARQTGDVNESFHEAEIAVKQISKCPIYWAFSKISMKANVLKTMATASNHRPCGEGCGESRGTQKEVSNG
jgi:hypothetical protein